MTFLSINLVFVAVICGSYVQSTPILSVILKNKQDAFINNRPIIGVLAQKTDGFLKRFGKTYIPACYIKYLESAGARVVPIRNDLPEEELEKLFSSLNGVLFPGGNVDIWNSGYGRAATIFFNLAVKANEAGDIFPIWGTCLGFEMLHVLAAKGKHILTRCSGRNVTLPLNFTKGYKNSKLFGQAPKDIIDDLGKHPITQNMHLNCVATQTYKQEPLLKKFFKVLSTNEDRDGKVRFSSTVEAIDYPFFATQWHPEKNQFEWTTTENMKHSKEAIMAAQYLANFFVDQARQSKHKFPSKAEEEAALIYKYKPVRMPHDTTHYEQCYFF